MCQIKMQEKKRELEDVNENIDKLPEQKKLFDDNQYVYYLSYSLDNNNY